MDTKVNSSAVESAKGQVPPTHGPLGRLVTAFNTDVSPFCFFELAT